MLASVCKLAPEYLEVCGVGWRSLRRGGGEESPELSVIIVGALRRKRFRWTLGRLLVDVQSIVSLSNCESDIEFHIRLHGSRLLSMIVSGS